MRSQVFRALAEGDWRGAADLVVANWGRLSSSDASLIEIVGDSLPPEAFDERPEWVSLRSYARHMRLDPRVRPALYVDPAREPRAHDSALTRTVLWTSQATAMRTSGRIDAAAERVDRARIAAVEVTTQDPVGRQLLPELQFQWALTYVVAGRSDQAFDLFATAFAGAVATSNVRVQVDASGELAWLLAICGYGITADAWIQRHGAVSDADGSFSTARVSGILARAMRALDRLEPTHAAELSDGIADADARDRTPFVAGARLLGHARTTGAVSPSILNQFDASVSAFLPAASLIPFIDQHNRVVRSDYFLLRGEASAAIRMLTDDAAATGLFASARLAAAYMLSGDLDTAEREARFVLGSRGTCPRIQIEAYAVLSASLLRKGNPVAAREVFRDAAALAVENDAYMPLGVIPVEDLRALVEHLPHLYDVAPIMTLRQGRIPTPPAAQPEVHVTPQEARIIGLLTGDPSEQEIAAAMGITRNTVRTHLRALYRKFAVNDRGALRAAARREGLL
ncbi:helix-turn-helix transcriptional regulator [Microbacterium sp. 2MCAF23]|uniref:helix-turn-helix transcriptional regulator n=1 Tax=Microbacterium sp. 2MCAF23 TaxID=3232985 RepID=UPI003F97157F